ncbi:slipin family protein [Conchiformibius steedae]|nr:slipin family protein [Conchiformibius steedae]
MLYSKIKVRMDERAIIVIDEKLSGVLEAGEHTVWHIGKSFSHYINNMGDLNVSWTGVEAALRFQRPIAENCWQIFDCDDDSVTVVWHKYLPAQVIAAGESRAFWRPEQGNLQHCRILKNDFWLPEEAQAALFQQPNMGSRHLQKYRVKPHEKLIITVNGELARVLAEGEYVLHLPADGSVETVLCDAAENLAVTWQGITDVLRFQRELAQQYWLIIDSPIGSDTLVWHERYLRPQIVPSGQSRAFWLPEQGQIERCVLSQHDFELPDTVAAALLKQAQLDLPLRKYTVKTHEKMLLTVRDGLQRVYGEGEYLLRLPDDSVKVLFADSRQPEFGDFKQIQAWARQQPELVAQHFDFVQAQTDELVLYSVGGVLTGWVAPERSAYFWKQPAQVLSFKHIDLKNGLQIDAETVAQLKAAKFWQTDFADIVYVVEVPPQHQGLVYLDQVLQPVLNTGNYHYWQLARHVHAKVVDMRWQSCEISGQELLSEDKVSLRINAVCNYRVEDAPIWLAGHRRPDEYLYRELQFAIRAVVGSKSIDQLLSDKQGIDEELTAMMQGRQLGGIEIGSAGVKDIILPGEIRTILTRVVEAEKSAQANNIRRREETAATRSLLNTARVMEENPTALRLKELETLEKVTEKIDKISVYGGLDGVLKGLINIQPPQP